MPGVSKLLEDPITLSELQIAIGNTKPGKAPGPDSFTIQYYKTLLPSLGNYLVKLFNDLGKGKTFHGSTLQAQISVIPKEGKDPTLCRSYWPISLSNTDFKLFTKNHSNQTTAPLTLPDPSGPNWLCTIERSQRQYNQSPQSTTCSQYQYHQYARCVYWDRRGKSL